MDELPAERFAESLGLPGMPKVKFLSRELAKKKKNASHAALEQARKAEASDGEDSGSASSSGEESGLSAVSDNEEAPAAQAEEKANRVRTKYDRMFERKNQNILSEHYTKLIDHANGSDSEDDFITLKRADHELPGALPESEYTSKRKQRLAQSKKAIAKGGARGSKLVFDDEGGAHEIYELKAPEDVFGEGGVEGRVVKEAGRAFAESERGRMREADVRDKEEAKEKKKEKKRKRKEREHEVCFVEHFSMLV